MNFIKNNKILITLILITVIFMVAILVIIFNNISLGSGNEYGNRLNDIEKYPITEEVVSSIKTEISSFDKVEYINYNLEGKIANFIIKVDDTLAEEDARNYGGKIIEKLSDDIKKYYDIQVMIDSNNNESTVYPIIGYKHKTSESLVWKQ